MKKPNDYDNAAIATGQDSSQLPKGGYICKIVSCKAETVNNKDRLVVAFDIAEGEYAGYYKQKFDADTRAEKKWRGTYRVFVQKNDGSTNPFFKGFITSVEASNKGYIFNWDESTLNDKLFGGLFSIEEYIGSDLNVRSTTRCNMAVSTETVKLGKYTLPKDVLVEKKSNESFYEIETKDSGEDDLPF